MEIEFRSGEIIFSRNLSRLDSFVLDFAVELAKREINYVVVSGYVAILFGRSRISEDADFLIEHIGYKKFLELWSGIQKKYECLNTGDPQEAFEEYLEKNVAIRIARKGSFIPNVEIKFAKTDLDRHSLEQRKRVKLRKRELYISPLELQISYKLFLGSEKDIEDARFLYKLFKDKLDNKLLTEFLTELKISKKSIKRYLD